MRCGAADHPQRRIPSGQWKRVKKMRTYIILCGPALLCLIAAPSPALSGGNTVRENLTTVTGTITYIDLEGGYYGIIADSGERYFPLNLEQQYKTDKTRVRIEGSIRRDVLTSTMWGVPLEIRKIERL